MEPYETDDDFEDETSDEESEPKKEPPPNDQTFALVVTLSEHELTERIVRTVADRLTKRFESVQRERIERIVDERVKAAAERELDEAVRRVIENGWTEQDRWGERGKKVTLEQRVNAVLAEQVDNYPRQSRYERLMKEAVEKAFREHLEPLVDEAKEKFHAAVDATMTARLSDELKRALGLR